MEWRGGRGRATGGAMMLCVGLGAGLVPAASAQAAAGRCEAEWHVTITREAVQGPGRVVSDRPGTVLCSGIFDGQALSGDPATSRLSGTIAAVSRTAAAAGCLVADSDLLYSADLPAIGFFEPSRLPMIGEITGRLGSGAFAVGGYAFAVSSHERSALTGAGTFTTDSGGACDRAGSGVLRAELALSPAGQGTPPELPGDGVSGVATSPAGSDPAESAGVARSARPATGRSRTTARQPKRRHTSAHRRHGRHARVRGGAGGRRGTR